MSTSSKYKILKSYQRYALHRLPDIILVHGSVLDFQPSKTLEIHRDSDESCNNNNEAVISTSPVIGCIVNAANESCLGGGGIDGAITIAGGITLEQDRWKLPIITNHNHHNEQTNNNIICDDVNIHEAITNKNNNNTCIRCPVGSAVITGPNSYGKLHVPYIIHAVGPNFHNTKHQQDGYTLLRKAYQSTLDVSITVQSPSIQQIAFCLLSAGIYRGTESLEQIIYHGVSAIYDWKPNSKSISHHVSSSLQQQNQQNYITSQMNDTILDDNNVLSSIYIFAFTENEAKALVSVSQEIFT